MTDDGMPLGQQTGYPDQYDPDQLFPVERAGNRVGLGLEDGLWPWYGEDRWNAWELSWLKPGGVPVVAVADIRFPASSACLVESKSLKLYLNSLNSTVFEDTRAVHRTLVEDLSRSAGESVGVTLYPVDLSAELLARPEGAELIDNTPVRLESEPAGAEVLTVDEQMPVQETLCSHLLRSLCPVTGQPDWASVMVRYEGPRMDRAGLLAYLVAFRNHQDFHEHCIERIFMDLMSCCMPQRLEVAAWYTRRGGLDINPWRSTHPGEAPSVRLLRQ